MWYGTTNVGDTVMPSLYDDEHDQRTGKDAQAIAIVLAVLILFSFLVDKFGHLIAPN